MTNTERYGSKEPLRWGDTAGYPLRFRVRVWASAWICQRDIGWTCAECKATHSRDSQASGDSL